MNTEVSIPVMTSAFHKAITIYPLETTKEETAEAKVMVMEEEWVELDRWMSAVPQTSARTMKMLAQTPRKPGKAMPHSKVKTRTGKAQGKITENTEGKANQVDGTPVIKEVERVVGEEGVGEEGAGGEGVGTDPNRLAFSSILHHKSTTAPQRMEDTRK